MGPRDRIASHLRRILVAAGMALPLPGHADTSTPDGGKGKKPNNPEPKKPEAKKPEGKKPKERERLGYEVVDMLAEPYIEKDEQGTLDLRTNPGGAAILIDGVDIGKKTPLHGWKLNAGRHAVTVKTGDTVRNSTVVIQADKPTVLTLDVHPSPAPEPKK
jgi:PEGA domain